MNLRFGHKHKLGWSLAVTILLGHTGAVFGQFDALIFSKTAAFRHDSIPQGITMIQQLGAANNFTTTFTENSAAFTTANLAQYEVVIFLNTTGDVLNSTQEAAFTSYIQSGKGYVGIHAASDTEAGWPWYVGLVGATFVNHSNIVSATIEVADRAHPSSSFLPKYWVRTDEWYNFNINPRGNVHVLATVDEGTYSGGTMGFDHPIAWCHEYDGGRSWYTAGGHNGSAYSEPLFRDHILHGIRWAAGAVSGDGAASVPSNYQKVVLDANVNAPMSLAVAPDRRVFFTERGGAIKIYKPSTQNTVLAGTVSVTTVNEEGALGIALDPNFATNQYVYILYSTSAAWEQRLSRFTMNGDTLNMGSEVVMLVIPEQRSNCCHQAGSLQFGNNGQLYISTGDNTNPFASDGYTPIDEQAGRSDWDAQKSSGNRNDLRGKVLRIVPQANGSYTIPAGNLFPSDGSNGRPEVYCMGLRNPFRISVDTETGWAYIGDVGPDANNDSGSRGPRGYDEINQARAASNFGWPYCIANNQPYRDYNFATGVSGSNFNCASPVNNSPNNTGSQSLPGASGAFIWYPYATSSQFPELGSGGRTIMAGPVYHYNPATPSGTKLPAYYDDTLFIYEFTRGWIKEVKLDDNGNILKINPFLQNMPFAEPLEMEIGPDGNLYMIEFGTDWSGGAGSKLVRIEYTHGSLSPVVVATATPDSGLAPLNVQFSSAGTFDPDGTIIAYEWDFTSNGSIDSTLANPSFTYPSNGNFMARLTVRDNEQNTAVANVPIVVGNNRPVVAISTPVNGGFFDWSSIVPFQVSVTDAQDGSTGGGQIPCSTVTVQPYLGHDAHAHPLNQFNTCTGAFLTQGDGSHAPEENIFHILEARYTDLGAPGTNPLTGTSQHVLQPKRRQAEHFTTMSGIQTEPTGDSQGGGLNIGWITHGDYISFNPMNLQNITAVRYRAASAGVGGNIELRADSPTGTLIGTAAIPATGGSQTYTNVTTSITNPGGTHHLYFVFKRNPGDDSLFNLNWIDFIGDGVSSGAAVTFDLGSPDIGNGMTSPSVGDGDLVSATIGGRLCKRNVSPANDFYFYFAVNDMYALNGSRPTNYITIDYYDIGTGTLTLQYDGTAGPYINGQSVTLTNTNTWKQFQYSVTDAYFGNRQNGGADFRIAMPIGVTRYLDIVNVASNTTGGAQAPYSGAASTIPGIIQVENYDIGGQGIAFSDASPGNAGGQYRSDNVDIETTADAGGGYNVGWIDAGEMLEYTVNVAASASYNIGMRLAAPASGGTYHLEVNGANITGTKTIPNTGGWQNWTTTPILNVPLNAGQQVLRLYVETGGWNVNYIDIQNQQAPASSPNPANGATGVMTNATLSWIGNIAASSHDIHFGTTAPGTFRGNQAGTTYNPGPLAHGTTYFWRIDEHTPGGTITGAVWSFTTLAVPGQASDPSPAHGVTGLGLTLGLSWSAGSNATSRDVYFGTVSPGTFLGNQVATTFNPGTLAPGTLYYWRIDEKNGLGTTTGSVWTLQTSAVPGADFDQDGDVDQTDFAHLQKCFNGFGPVPPGCEDSDLNSSNTVDSADFNLFLPCIAGSNRPPGC